MGPEATRIGHTRYSAAVAPLINSPKTASQIGVTRARTRASPTCISGAGETATGRNPVCGRELARSPDQAESPIRSVRPSTPTGACGAHGRNSTQRRPHMRGSQSSGTSHPRRPRPRLPPRSTPRTGNIPHPRRTERSPLAPASTGPFLIVRVLGIFWLPARCAAKERDRIILCVASACEANGALW